MKLHILAGLLISFVVAYDAAAQTTDEARQIQILQSSTDAEKEDACRRLKQNGTAKSVPALAQLLADERLYQSACDALETMPSPEAGEALRAALKTPSGNAKAGIIHTLGEKRYRAAAADLAQILNNTDPLIASSAARALYAGAPNIERVDRLVQAIAKQKGQSLAAIDDTVALVDAKLEENRRKAA